MPIYMDFHDLPEGVTAEHVAQMHQADLKIEHKFNCRGLTYWCDEIRQTAFCLIEAPNKQAIVELHEQAHGGVPQRIIEVNDHIVESFLGRIQDPQSADPDSLQVIDDSAYRVLLLLDIRRTKLRAKGHSTLRAALRGYAQSIKSILTDHNGRLVEQHPYRFLASFTSAEKAIGSALAMRELHNCVITPDLDFVLGICAGNPVTARNHLFEETIATAAGFCRIAENAVLVSKDILQLYEQECHLPLPEGVRLLEKPDELFVTQLMDYLASNWGQSQVSAADVHQSLGYSKSGLYRILTRVAGISPQQLLKRYRLEQALELLDQQTRQIAEVAYQCGFSSPTYFSRCFQEHYGIRPSDYLKAL